MTYLIRLTYPERHKVYFMTKERLRDCRAALRSNHDSHCRGDVFLLQGSDWTPAQGYGGGNSPHLVATFVNYNFNCMEGYSLEPSRSEQEQDIDSARFVNIVSQQILDEARLSSAGRSFRIPRSEPAEPGTAELTITYDEVGDDDIDPEEDTYEE